MYLHSVCLVGDCVPTQCASSGCLCTNTVCLMSDCVPTQCVCLMHDNIPTQCLRVCACVRACLRAMHDIDAVVIPSGLTPLVQPLDISIDRPFKQQMRHLWEHWMIHSAHSRWPPSCASQGDSCAMARHLP